jgi:glycosyltransferase involved in cell wall biosynthesis
MPVDRLSILLPLFQPNVNATFENWHGGRVYIENFVRVLSDPAVADRASVYVLTDGPVDLPILRTLFRAAAVDGIFRPDFYPMLLKPMLMATLVDGAGQVNMPAAQKLLAGADVVFPILHTDVNAPNGLHWIPDFQHKHLPDMFDTADLARRDRTFGIMTRERNFLLLSSRAAEADCKRFYPDMRAHTYVWPFSSSLDARMIDPGDVRAAFKLPAKFLFAPNQFWKHKDHATLFRAVKIARDAGVEIVLACTGSAADYRHPQHYAQLQAYVNEAGLSQNVRFLGMVAHGVLGQLFRQAAAIVQPSRFEGWSTVVEDAKALGRPLIASDLPVHLEQMESAVSPMHFFKTGDADDLARHLIAQWNVLQSGPDMAAEAKALETRRARELGSAEQFLAIAADMRARLRQAA